MTSALAQGIIDALPEPAFLLTGEGGIRAANRAACAMLGPEAAAGHLAERLVTPVDELARFLERARSTGSPLPGALVFRTEKGEARLRVHCGRLARVTEDVVLMLRCDDPRGDRFSVLDERVRQLDGELRRRVREKATLHEALIENRTLMRELQHRVKNNIQMMISLLSMSAPTASSDDVRRLVMAVKRRFGALATTQDLIYEAQSGGDISARELFERLAQALEESAAEGVSIVVDVADVRLPQEKAHCLALIVNELVTNSIKHGIAGDAGTVRLSLGRAAGQLCLVVRDDGDGYPRETDAAGWRAEPADGLLDGPFDEPPGGEAPQRTSGLMLIRGLCRQIGASLDLRNENGATSVVTFGEGV